LPAAETTISFPPPHALGPSHVEVRADQFSAAAARRSFSPGGGAPINFNRRRRRGYFVGGGVGGVSSKFR
jgi:hypothetical protein